MKIIRAEAQHIEMVAVLFNLYRQFYDQPDDIGSARDFISARIKNHESIVFVALDEQGGAWGFAQLYESFCSVEADKIIILYDLYVAENGRRRGVGEALMNQARQYGEQCGACRIDLLTGVTNTPGQSLYEKLGYERVNQDFYAYSLTV